MKRRLLVLILVTIINLCAYCQCDTINNTFKDKSFYLRASIGYLHGLNSELGIGRQVQKAIFKYGHFYYWDIYLSNEFIVNNNFIIGPKIGGELFAGGPGASSGLVYGVEIVNYMSKSDNTIVICPKIFWPLVRSSFCSFSYGYNIFVDKNNINGLYHHKFMIAFNLNYKAHKLISEKYREMEKDLKNGH
jgi:hypothetical protein